MNRKIIFQLPILIQFSGASSHVRKNKNKDPETYPLSTVGTFGNAKGISLTEKTVRAKIKHLLLKTFLYHFFLQSNDTGKLCRRLYRTYKVLTFKLNCQYH